MNLSHHTAQSQKKKRIAIIGMGYAGLALCFHLLQLQAGEITLFDPYPQGGGASPVSAGLLHLYPGGDARLPQEGYEGFQATQELLSAASGFLKLSVASQRGLIRLATSPKQRAAFLERAHQHKEITFLDEEEMAKRLPFLPKKAGLWIPHAQVVDAQGYLEGLREICFKEGAHFVQQEVKPGSTWHGFDLQGEFDVVVIAMGASAAHIPQLANFSFRAIKGQILEMRWPKDLPELDCPITGDCYLLPQYNQGRCIVGATFEKAFHSPLPDLAEAEKLLRPRIEAIAPQFARSECLNVRAGVRLTTPARTPLAQQIKPGLFALVALGSKGLLHHALLGRRIAEAIVKERA